MIDPDRLLFIAGLHRSGSSLLHRMLRDHPDISGFSNTGVPEDEGQHLQSVLPTGAFHGGPGKFAFRQAARMDENHALASQGSARELLSQWSPYWDLERRYLLEKSPPNLLRTRFLQALFPGCRFILLLRHPAVVALATRKWSRTPLVTLLEHSVRAQEQALSDLPRLRQARVVRYESLVAAPQQTLDSLMGWLGLAPLALGQSVERDKDAVYLAQWREQRGLILATLGQAASSMRQRVEQMDYQL